MQQLQVCSIAGRLHKEPKRDKIQNYPCKVARLSRRPPFPAAQLGGTFNAPCAPVLPFELDLLFSCRCLFGYHLGPPPLLGPLIPRVGGKPPLPPRPLEFMGGRGPPKSPPGGGPPPRPPPPPPRPPGYGPGRRIRKGFLPGAGGGAPPMKFGGGWGGPSKPPSPPPL